MSGPEKSIDFSLPTVLFGGTFDPVHQGHLHVAREALKALPEAKQLVFVPAWHSPGKKPACASPASRLSWVRMVAEPAGFGVWDLEVRRGGPESYTVDTLEAAHRLGASAEKLWWLLGADAYAGFSRWKNPARIRQLARLLVVARPGQSILPQETADRILSVPLHPASSTEIRAHLAKGEVNLEWLPPPLRQAISEVLPDQNPYATNKE